MNIRNILIARIDAEIAGLQARKLKINDIPNLGELDISIEPSLYGSQIDFDRLSHPEVIKVIQAIGGKWNKTIQSDGDRINYETSVNGVTFRCYAGEPPPNCKIVEVLETVPAQPERTITVRKLQCQ